MATASLAACALMVAACSNDPAPTEEPPLAGASIGGEFELVGPDGETVRWADFDGQCRVVYFGYAFCPDICPTDVQRMTQGLKVLGENEPQMAASITPIFITIDPDRDTREIVDEFTNAFSDDLIGLTGTPEQVRAAADAFKVYYERGETTGDGSYLMNHSNIVYLFDKDGQPLATLPVDEGPEAVAAEIQKWVS
ncbi:SCO family protein [Erythrobacter sp. YT30]|uniref:SCO family protein n=1 Tax=Erythrobacter sp. YT30 TaxID=1735012 RepID=UPI003516B70E